MSVELLFARYASRDLDPKNTIGAKFQRLLDTIDMESMVKDKRVALKMHLGNNVGFSTIHPFFTRKLVTRIKNAGADEVFVCDSPLAVRLAAERGYTAETVGCHIVPVAGTSDKYQYTLPIEPPFRELSEIEIAGEIMDADALIDFSHVKGHGACGFGGASKNLSMGAVVQSTRKKLHALEGGLHWDADKCSHCGLCVESCPNKCLSFEDDVFTVFYHDCKYCQHCGLICPEKAITMAGGGYKDFQRGMALATAAILRTFAPENTYFINMLTDITVFCDCWGMTTPALVPDIGVLAGSDICAIETATLDLVKEEDFRPGSLPENMSLGAGKHLFEKIHGKDPFVVIEYLQELGHGSTAYHLKEIE